MTLRAEAILDDRRRMVTVSYFDWETPVGRIQRGECDGYRAPANWPFNLTPYRMTPQPFVNQVLQAELRWATDTRDLSLSEWEQVIGNALRAHNETRTRGDQCG